MTTNTDNTKEAMPTAEVAAKVYTPAGIIAAFLALPLPERMRVYADGLRECSTRMGPWRGSAWGPSTLEEQAEKWAAEDAATAERAALVEDLARELFRAHPSGARWEDVARSLLDSDRFDIRRKDGA